MKKAGYKVRYYQKPKIPIQDLDELYYFAGLLCTDGHIQYDALRKTYRIIFYAAKDEEKSLIIKLIKRLFNYNSSIRIKKYGFSKNPNYEIYISSKKLCEFFIKLGVPYGGKSFTINVPKKITNSKRASHFIRGIFDGDGSIIAGSSYALFKIFSASERFINGINKILNKIGINSAKIRKEREKLWVLRVNKKKDIKKLYSLIYHNSRNWFYPRKKLKWQTIHLKIL